MAAATVAESPEIVCPARYWLAMALTPSVVAVVAASHLLAGGLDDDDLAVGGGVLLGILGGVGRSRLGQGEPGLISGSLGLSGGELLLGRVDLPVGLGYLVGELGRGQGGLVGLRSRS